MSELEMCRNSKSWEAASTPGKGPHMTLGNRRNFGVRLGEEGGRPVCRSLPQTSPKGRGGRGTRQPPLQASGGRAGGITRPGPLPPPSPHPRNPQWRHGFAPTPSVRVFGASVSPATFNGRWEKGPGETWVLWGWGQREAPSEVCLAGVRGGERPKFAYSIPNSKKRDAYCMLHKVKSDLGDLGFPQSFW